MSSGHFTHHGSFLESEKKYEVTTEWQYFLKRIDTYELQVISKIECLQLYGHDDYTTLHKNERLNFVQRMERYIAEAELQSEMKDGRRPTS